MSATSAISEETEYRIIAGDQSLDTPPIAVDLDLLERTITEMAALAARYGVSLRPRAKTHKSPHEAAALSQALSANDRTLDLYLEVNTGQDRAGAHTVQEAADLAVANSRLSGLRLAGVMMDESRAGFSHPDEIATIAQNAGQALVDTAERIRNEGSRRQAALTYDRATLVSPGPTKLPRLSSKSASSSTGS